MKLVYTVQLKNIKEREIFVFLLLRDCRVNTDGGNLILCNNSHFYHVYEGSNYENDGQYEVLGANINRKDNKVLTLLELINQ